MGIRIGTENELKATKFLRQALRATTEQALNRFELIWRSELRQRRTYTGSYRHSPGEREKRETAYVLAAQRNAAEEVYKLAKMGYFGQLPDDLNWWHEIMGEKGGERR